VTTVINQRGRHPGNNLRHREYTESGSSPLEIGRNLAREIYEDSTVVFEVQQASDGLGHGSAKLWFDPDISILRE